MALERRFKATPAWDERSKGKGGGQHCVDLVFAVVGAEGAYHFTLYTGWYLEMSSGAFPAVAGVPKPPFAPLPADVGYHGSTPAYEGQAPVERCEFMGGGKCYSDGSGLQAYDLWNILLRDGSDGVWKELERRYHAHFGEGKS